MSSTARQCNTQYARSRNLATANPRCTIATRTQPRTATAGISHFFATEAVNSGLPVHIAAKVLGHLDWNTTQGYVAIYPEQVIRHYREFIDRRRRYRPAEEYREPTEVEWNEFEAHFGL
ncbi:MAG: hypothetical protein ACRD0J_18405, partial [Acidimicrobiales bacterium]